MKQNAPLPERFFSLSFILFTLFALYEQIKHASFIYWMLTLYEHITTFVANIL